MPPARKGETRDYLENFWCLVWNGTDAVVDNEYCVLPLAVAEVFTTDVSFLHGTPYDLVRIEGNEEDAAIWNLECDIFRMSLSCISWIIFSGRMDAYTIQQDQWISWFCWVVCHIFMALEDRTREVQASICPDYTSIWRCRLNRWNNCFVFCHGPQLYLCMCLHANYFGCFRGYIQFQDSLDIEECRLNSVNGKFHRRE